MRADSRLSVLLARLSSRSTAGRPSWRVRTSEPRARRSMVATSPRVTSRPSSSATSADPRTRSRAVAAPARGAASRPRRGRRCRPQVQAQGRDPAGDLAKRGVELAQRGGRHLDRDLLRRQAVDVNLGDAALEQLALDPAHDRTQALPVAAGHQQPGHRLVVDQARDLRLLRGGRQVADRRDPLLHLFEGQHHVGAHVVPQGDPRCSLAR